MFIAHQSGPRFMWKRKKIIQNEFYGLYRCLNKLISLFSPKLRANESQTAAKMSTKSFTAQSNNYQILNHFFVFVVQCGCSWGAGGINFCLEASSRNFYFCGFLKITSFLQLLVNRDDIFLEPVNWSYWELN